MFGAVVGRQPSACVVDVVQGAELVENVLVVGTVGGVTEQGNQLRVRAGALANDPQSNIQFPGDLPDEPLALGGGEVEGRIHYLMAGLTVA